MPIKLNKVINSLTPEDTYRLSNWTERIDVARPHIFDFEYELINQTPEVNNKETFERLFLKKYYNREIGANGGTVTAFKHDLEVFLMEELPVVNQLLETLGWEYDPLINFKSEEQLTRQVVDAGSDSETIANEFDQARQTDTDITETVHTDFDQDKTIGVSGEEALTSATESTENQTVVDNGKDVEFIVPQGMTNIDDMNFSHATSAKQHKNTTDSEGETSATQTDARTTTTDTVDATTGQTETERLDNRATTDTSNSTSDTTRNLSKENVKDETYTKVVQGVQNITYQQLIADYRRNILNVITDLVERCDVLFYQIYDY